MNSRNSTAPAIPLSGRFSKKENDDPVCRPGDPNKKFEDVVKVFYFYKSITTRTPGSSWPGITAARTAIWPAPSLIAELRVPDIHLTGHVEFPELLAYYRMADYFLSLSEHEASACHPRGLSVGIPVLAFAAGAVRKR